MAQMFQAPLQRGRFAEVRPPARKLLAGHGAASAALPGRERRALALIHLGIADAWAGRRRRARARWRRRCRWPGTPAVRTWGSLLWGSWHCSKLPTARCADPPSSRTRPSTSPNATAGCGDRPRPRPIARSRSARYHRNSLAQAGQYADLAEEAARASREPTVALLAGVTRTRIALLRGDPRQPPRPRCATRATTPATGRFRCGWPARCPPRRRRRWSPPGGRARRSSGSIARPDSDAGPRRS